MEPVSDIIGHCFVVGDTRHQLRASMSAGWRGSAGQVRRNFRQSLQKRIFNLLQTPLRPNGEVREAVKDFCSKLQDAQRDSLGQAADVDAFRREIRKVAKAIGFPISRLFHSKADRNASRKAPPVRLDISDVSFIPGTFFFEDKTEKSKVPSTYPSVVFTRTHRQDLRRFLVQGDRSLISSLVCFHSLPRPQHPNSLPPTPDGRRWPYAHYSGMDFAAWG